MNGQQQPASAALHRSPPGEGEDSSLAVGQDFLFTNQDFDWLRRVANEHSGIVLPESKRNMIYSRLSKRLRRLRLTKFREYRGVLEGGDKTEFSEFINALTTNLTSFFRENHHFEHIEQVAIPELLPTRRPNTRIRVWSAGCSTGEEPYSVSMTIEGALSRCRSEWDYRILATDLDTNVLANAASGIYASDRVAGLDKSILRRAFLRGTGSLEGQFRIKPQLQAPVTFEQLNLVKDWSMDEQFDLIFCRNVVIYFDKPTQKRLFERFADCLNPGGYLYIGHSETLFQLSNRFELVGKTTYQRLP